jgi:hypothetical protein
LADLAQRYLGNQRYAMSIVLATNSRTDQHFDYIGEPDAVSASAHVCVPSKREARHLLKTWQSFERAMDAARLPRAVHPSPSLVTVGAQQAVDLVAWKRDDQVEKWKDGPGSWIETAPDDVWVTVEPSLKAFCQKYVQARHPSAAALTLRLEQHLGLAPASNKASFVRIHLDHPPPGALFRPCADPATDRPACVPGSPSENQDWFYKQYFGAYGTSLMGEAPWTALGYTFDWAPLPGNARRFTRVGESEFVIRKGAAIEIQGAVSTAEYCSLSKAAAQ